MTMTFEQFQEKNPEATYLDYINERFPIEIPQGTFGESIIHFGDVSGAYLNGPADKIDVTIFGNVDTVYNNDGWFNNWNIYGDAGFISVTQSIDTSVSANSVGYAFASQSSGLNFSFSNVSDVFWNGVDDSELGSIFLGDAIVIGDENDVDAFFAGSVSIQGDDNQGNFLVLENGTSTGNGSRTVIGTLEETFDLSGQEQTLSIGNADGAQITIGTPQQPDDLDPLCELLGICEDTQGTETTDTFVFVGSGDVNVTDFGRSSTIRLGDGNDSATLQGTDTVIEMGDGFDFVSSSADGALVAGAEWVDHNGGNLTLLDVPLFGTTEMHGQDLTFDRALFAFGENVDGNAQLDTGNGILTVVGGAETYIPTDELMLA